MSRYIVRREYEALVSYRKLAFEELVGVLWYIGSDLLSHRGFEGYQREECRIRGLY